MPTSSPVNVDVFVSFGNNSSQTPPTDVESARQTLQDAIPQASAETETALAATFAAKLANSEGDLPSTVVFATGAMPGLHRLGNSGEWTPDGSGVRWLAEYTPTGEVWYFFLQP